MPRRILNLTILASWLFAWSSAALHHHSHDCHHETAETAREETHCGHHHHHDVPAEEPTHESWDAECRLCELLAVPFDAPQSATVVSLEPMPSIAVWLTAPEPTIVPPRRWNGRAPPLSS